MEIDVKHIEELNRDANLLSEKVDEVVSAFVMERPDDGSTPILILAAFSTILAKLAVIVGEGREFILETLDDMLPDNETLKALETESDSIVIPQMSNKLH